MKRCHDAVIGHEHACCRQSLKAIDQKTVPGQPVARCLEVFSCKGAEEEDEEIVQDDVVQAESKCRNGLAEWKSQT